LITQLVKLTLLRSEESMIQSKDNNTGSPLAFTTPQATAQSGTQVPNPSQQETKCFKCFKRVTLLKKSLKKEFCVGN
jgi:hypothetical protein